MKYLIVGTLFVHTVDGEPVLTLDFNGKFLTLPFEKKQKIAMELRELADSLIKDYEKEIKNEQ